MKLIYVAGPYAAPDSAGEFDNIMRARAKGQELIHAGYAVIIPHLNSMFMHVTREQIMPVDLEIINRCDAIYLLKGWKQSKGAVREWKRALALGLELYIEGAKEPPEVDP